MLSLLPREVPCDAGLGLGPFFVADILYGAAISQSWYVLWGLGIQTVTEASWFRHHHICH